MPGGQNFSAVILGQTGSGKSTLAREIIATYPRVVILDTMGEYDDLPGAVVREGKTECINALLALKDEKKFVLDCLTLHQQDGLDILAVAFEIPDILVVIEEASLYCDPYSLPDEIASIVRYGRKRNIDFIAIARRPSEISRELTAQARLLVTFRQVEPVDIQYLRARIRNAERAATLPPYHVLIGGETDRAPLPVLSRLQENQLTLFREGVE